MLSSYGTLDKNVVEAFEKKHRIHLPDYYRHYLLENNG